MCFKGTAKASATWELQVGNHETFVFELRNKIKWNQVYVVYPLKWL